MNQKSNLFFIFKIRGSINLDARHLFMKINIKAILMFVKINEGLYHDFFLS